MAKETETATDTNVDGKETATDSNKTETTILQTPVSVVNPDGTFVQNWRDSLPEEIRTEKCLDTVTDFPNAIKQLVSHKKMVGRDKVVIPNDKSKPEEWDAFYEAGGRPKTADDYKVDVPEDMKEFFPKEELAETRKLAHQIGASQKQYEAFMKARMASIAKVLQEQEQAEIQAKKEADDKLHQEFGAAYPERMHVASRLVAEAIPDEEKRMTFLEKYGNDPDFIRFTSVVGARMLEHTAKIAELTHNTPAEAQAKIRELQGKPGYMDLSAKMTEEEKASITEQIRELYKQAYPEKTGR